jgi:hypothetical protein
MKLFAPARRGGFTAAKGLSPTTAPGYVNPNGQKVLADTGAPSTNRDRQSIYRLSCGRCSHEYGCNGMDIKDRRCPRCQQGAEGEPLRERPPMFDFGD